MTHYFDKDKKPVRYIFAMEFEITEAAKEEAQIPDGFQAIDDDDIPF